MKIFVFRLVVMKTLHYGRRRLKKLNTDQALDNQIIKTIISINDSFDFQRLHWRLRTVDFEIAI